MTLKELRLQSGKSAKEVAEKLGVTTSAISQYEHGVRELKFGTAIKLAEIYDVSLDDEMKEMYLNSHRNGRLDNPKAHRENRRF